MKWKSCKLKYKYWLFSSEPISGSAKKPDEKKGKENEQTLANFSSAHCCLKEKCQLVKTSYTKRITFFLLAYNKHLINQT